MALAKQRQHERHVDGPHRVQDADVDVTGLDAGQRLQLGPRGIELVEDPARPRDEQLARLGQRDAAGGALHQCEPDLLLEALDLLRECRLGDVLTRRRAGEMALVGDRDEVAQLSEFHKQIL